MKHLNTDPHFLEAVEKFGLLTESGAEKRLEKAFGTVDNLSRPLTFVIKIGERFMPVAVMNDRTSWVIGHAARYNVYCTN